MNEEIIKDVGALEVEAEHLKETQEEIKENVSVIENRQKWTDEGLDRLFQQLNDLVNRIEILEVAGMGYYTDNEETPTDEATKEETIIEAIEPEAPQKEKRRSILGII